MEDNIGNKEHLIDLRGVGRKLGISAMTISRWHKRGVIPQPIRINNKKYWRGSVIDSWLEERQDEADAKYWNEQQTKEAKK